MGNYQHILCATDFSECSDEACAHAAELAQESSARLTLLHVVDHFPQDRSNAQIAPEDKDPKQFRENKARADLEKQAARLDSPKAQLVVSVSSHSPAYEIIRYAATNNVDLIVVASHENTWVERLFGSTASRIQRKAKCEVLVVPTN